MAERRARRPIVLVIEILLILLILAVIAGLYNRPVVGPTAKASVKATKATLSYVRVALKAFAVEFRRYPTIAEGLSALVAPPPSLPRWDHQFLEKLPKDAWGRALRYRFPGAADPNTFDLVSAGEDGEFETVDDIVLDDR